MPINNLNGVNETKSKHNFAIQDTILLWFISKKQSIGYSQSAM